MKLSLAQLKEQADQLRASGEHLSAIRIYIAILRRNPEDYMARLRLGEALERSEAGGEAIKVYEAVCRFCINNGRPLVAIVAGRAMENLGKRPDTYLLDLANRYSQDAENKTSRPTRPAIAYNEPLVDSKELQKACTVPELFEEAGKVGTDLMGLDETPQRYITIPLLSELSAPKLIQVIRTILVHRLPVGHIIFQQGQPGQSCFLISQGTVQVKVKRPHGGEVEVATLSDRAIFGEMSLITSTPRSATVQVIEEADILELGPEVLAAIGDELPRVAAALDKLAQRRWMSNLMKQSPVFKAFSDQERMELLKHFQAHEVAVGTSLIVAGQKLNGIYLVVRGEVGIKERTPEGHSKIVAREGPGSTLGLEVVLSDQPAKQTATTTTPATVLFLPAIQVRRLVEAVPEFAQALKHSAPPL